jgi:hypothetical protein
MKKTFLSIAILASLSGVALAERPTESSDRVDYKFLGTETVNQSVSSTAGLTVDGVIVDEAEQRRIDEKNDVNDNGGAGGNL